MEDKLFIISIFVTFLCLCVNAEDCPTPLGNNGTCVILNACEPLKRLAEKRDHEALRKYSCGFAGIDPMVCCPPNDGKCTTVEGEEGICTELKNCDRMQKAFSNAIYKGDNMDYIKRAKCIPAKPTNTLTVCCKQETPKPISSKIKQCTLSATPPAHDSNCCGFESTSDVRIIGGNATSLDQFPWVAMIDYEREGLRCGGSLISGKYVLTAAHCLIGNKRVDLKAISVRLGEYNTTNPGHDCIEVAGGGVDCTDGAVTVEIESYVVHEDFDPSQVFRYHDIALIRLKETVNYTDFIRPICLPTSDFTLSAKADLQLWVSGWGIFDQSKELSTVKLYGVLPYVQFETCQNRFSINSRQSLLGSQICVGGEVDKDVCNGDSGGPLMIMTEKLRYDLAGVISFGSNSCGLENFPSIYTKVYDYLDWIQANMKP
ncbi:phenoloxidase-activating enzyme-like isoform X2 [Epargyreus clarus]|uniref:phenoloxidase-activating enzyme-like isoform X2 n=1 Tax=Epargyreus clarus TaxID=520877 RepID=UPI003C2E5983